MPLKVCVLWNRRAFMVRIMASARDILGARVLSREEKRSERESEDCNVNFFRPETLQRPPVPAHGRAIRCESLLSAFPTRKNVRFRHGDPKMQKSARAHPSHGFPESTACEHDEASFRWPNGKLTLGEHKACFRGRTENDKQTLVGHASMYRWTSSRFVHSTSQRSVSVSNSFRSEKGRESCRPRSWTSSRVLKIDTLDRCRHHCDVFGTLLSR